MRSGSGVVVDVLAVLVTIGDGIGHGIRTASALLGPFVSRLISSILEDKERRILHRLEQDSLLSVDDSSFVLSYCMYPRHQKMTTSLS